MPQLKKPVIHEQNILKKEPPPGSTWNNENIMAYLEANGINRSSTVYEKGVAPNRIWSNDHSFGANYKEPEVQENPEIRSLKEQVEELKKQLESRPVASHSEVEIKLDKRTKEYRDS